MFLPFSGVKLIAGKDDDGNIVVYRAGDETGRVLEMENPWGSQQMANDVLRRIRGYEYKPFRATGAVMNPAAELGDAVSVGDVYSVLDSVDTTFSPLMSAEIAARESGILEHEYPYDTKNNRETAREISGIRTQFVVEMGRIETRIDDMDSGYSSRFTQLSNSITAEVSRATSAEGTLRSRITQTESSITYEVTARMNADNALSSRITQNANSITSEVTARMNADNALSSRITQNATSITSEVTRATTVEGNLSTRITQTANSIQAQVNGIYAPEYDSRKVYKKNDVVKKTNGTTITYYKAIAQNEFSNVSPPNASYWAVVSSPTVQSIANIGLDGVTLGYKASDLENSATITLNRNGVEIQSQVITMTNVTADSISANNITGGTMQAGDIAIDGKFTVKLTENNQTIDCGWLGGGYAKIPDYPNTYADAVALGADGIDGVYVAVSDGVAQNGVKSGSAMLRNRDAVVYCNASFFQNQSGAGSFTDVHPYCVMETSNGDHYIAVTYNAIRASEQITVVSDRRGKTGIDYDMSQYENLFRELKPCSYLRKNADKKHIGFIAQDVDKSLMLNKIENSALIGRQDGMDEDPMLSLAYGEFIALNTYMIQKLMERMDSIERKVESTV